MLLDLLTFGVLAFVGVRLVGAARFVASGPGRARVRLIVSGLRWRHFAAVPFVLAGVAATAGVLWAVPPLRFGWWTAIGGEGNPVLGTTGRTRGTVLEWLVPVAFVVLLAPAVPLFAQAEEVAFRRGAEAWSFARRAWRGVQFGLAHALIGIPLAVALALSVGGWYFTWVYRRAYRRDGARAALLESTRAHTAYNLVILGLVVASLLAGAFA